MAFKHYYTVTANSINFEKNVKHFLGITNSGIMTVLKSKIPRFANRGIFIVGDHVHMTSTRRGGGGVQELPNFADK